MTTTNRKLFQIVLGGSIINLLLFGAGASFHVFFIRPAYETFRQGTHALAALENRDASLRTLAREVEERTGDIHYLTKAFLDQNDIISFITLLETMAAESNVTLTISAADINTEVPTAGEAQFTLSLTGPLDAIMQFVTRAENMPYFTDIPSFTVSSQGGATTAQLQLLALTL